MIYAICRKKNKIGTPNENPPSPCGLSRLSSLPSLSSFGREVYLSLNLSPGAPSPILYLTFWWPAVSPIHIKRQARASKTPKTQAGYIADFLFGFGLSYEYHAEPIGSLIVFGRSPFQKPYKTIGFTQFRKKHNEATVLILR